MGQPEIEFNKAYIFAILEENGFNPISNNNYIHIHFKLGNSVIDIYPTTSKFKIKIFIRKFKYETIIYGNFYLFLEKLEELKNDLPDL